MYKYFALHRLKKSAEQVSHLLNKKAPAMARAMAVGETSCRCLKTWNPLAYGREDYLFSIWEAGNAEDIEATIRSFGFFEYVTIDIMQVDEIDWPQLVIIEKKID
jgi:hypothetical protein